MGNALFECVFSALNGVVTGADMLWGYAEHEKKSRKRPAVVLGVQKAACCDSGFLSYLGEHQDADTGVWREVYGKKVSFSLEAAVYLPEGLEEKEQEAQRLFDEICQVSGAGYGFRIKEMSRGKMVHDPDMAMMVCPVTLMGDAWLYADRLDGEFTDFYVRGVIQ